MYKIFYLPVISIFLFNTYLAASPTVITNPLFNVTQIVTQNISLNFVLGSKFIPSTNLLINQLGYYSTSAVPLTTFKNVGLWDASTQQLLASATILPTGVQLGNYLYEAISPITLISGHTYVIGTSELAGSYKNTALIFFITSGVTLPPASPVVTFNIGNIPANSLAYPSLVLADGGVLANAAAFATPEPEAYLLLGSMLFVALLGARAKKLKKV